MKPHQAVVLMAGWLAITCLFLPGIHGPLLLDDRSVLSPLESSVADGEGLKALWSRAGHLGRPVSMLSFMSEFRLFGVSTVITKAINVVIHFLNSLLVSLLAVRLLRLSGSRVHQAGWWIGVFWALLPAHVGTVLYATQRMTLLSALFVLIGLHLVLLAGAAPRGRNRWVLIGSFLACVLLACLAKENGILLLPLAALLLCFPLPGRGTIGPMPWLGRMLAWVSILAALGFLAWCFLWLPVEQETVYSGRGWTPWQRLVTQWQVLWLYAAQVLMPLPQLLPFHHDHWVASRSLTDGPWPLLALIGWLALLALLLRHREHVPLGALGVLFFLVGHSLEASPYPLELVFEHRNYLPSVGLVLALAALLLAAPVRAPVRLFVTTFTTVVFAFACHARVLDWSDEHRLVMRNFELNPASPRAASHLAAVLTAHGAFPQAVDVLGTVAHPGAALQRLYVLCRHAELDEAGFTSLLPAPPGGRLDGYATTAAVQLSDVLHDGHCRAAQGAFVAWLMTAVNEGFFVHEDERRKLSVHVAHGLMDTGSPTAALAWVESQAARDPRTLPLLMAADWRSEAGDCALARRHLAQARITARNDVVTDWAPLLQETTTLLEERGCGTASGSVPGAHVSEEMSP